MLIPPDGFHQGTTDLRPKEYRVLGCRAHYTIETRSRVPMPEEGTQQAIALADALQRFKIGVISDSGHKVPALSSTANPTVPWQASCDLRIEGSSISLGGYFLGDALYYFPVLCQIALDAFYRQDIRFEPGSTETSYGFDLVTNPGTNLALAAHLETARGWTKQGPQRFSCNGQLGLYASSERTVDLSQRRVSITSTLFHASVLRAVDAVAPAEEQLLEVINSLSLPVRILPLE